MLKEVYFGYHYFEMALMFRSSMLINGILCSIESLYGLTDGHIEQLEQCDRMLMRQLFSSVSTTAIEAFYYETGTLPLRFTIIARRLMYLWCILQKPENELVKNYPLFRRTGISKSKMTSTIAILRYPKMK